MAVEEAAAWYQQLREVEYLQDTIHSRVGFISRKISGNTMDKNLSEAEVEEIKELRKHLMKESLRVGLEMPLKPDFSGMTETERAETVERLRNDAVRHAQRLTREGDPRGTAMEFFARIVDFDPKQDGMYYSRYTVSYHNRFDLDEESPIGPMRYIDSRRKRESDYPWLDRAVNFLSVKIASSDVGFPIHVYGTIIVRDSVDERCVYHFRRDSDNCQVINSEAESLILTGPKRGLALCSDVYLETDLKMKDPLVQNRELSKGLISIRDSSFGPSVTGYTVRTESLATRLSTVDVTYAVVDRALEGTIAVEVQQQGSSGFHGQITASTANMQDNVFVLYDSSKEDDDATVTTTIDDGCGELQLMRHVVSVFIKDWLVIVARDSDGKSESKRFAPIVNGRDEGQLAVGATKMRVKLAWSVVNA